MNDISIDISISDDPPCYQSIRSNFCDQALKSIESDDNMKELFHTLCICIVNILVGMEMFTSC